MKTISIIRLKLENFKCHKALELDFGGESRSIYAANGKGKTSVYDALTWLLFGKSSNGDGEKNISIKPLASDGSVLDHEAITAVEAELLICEDVHIHSAGDGTTERTVTLRRTLREVWATRRGSTTAEYNGNTSDYFVDGVPCKKTEYERRIEELIDEKSFILLTNLHQFTEKMDWKERRNVLYSIAGTLTDRQIMESNEEFAPLIAAVGPLELEGFKKVLMAKKKGLSGTRDEIPARISECEKTVEDLSRIDFAIEQQKLDEQNACVRKLQDELTKVRNSSAVADMVNQSKEVGLQLQELRMQNAEYRRAQQKEKPDTAAIERRVSALKKQLEAERRMLANDMQMKERYEQQVNALRAEWIAANNEIYTDGVCPSCGQMLPADRLAASRAAFDERKRNRLDAAVKAAETAKNSLASTVVRIAEEEAEVQAADTELEAAEKELAAAVKAADAIRVEDIEGYTQSVRALEGKQNEILDKIEQLRKNSRAEEQKLEQKIADASWKASSIQRVIGQRSALEYAEMRIEQLRADAKAAAAELEQVEQKLMLIDRFSMFKAQYIEASVNGYFRIANFRLFRHQANGGLEDRCDVTVNGVPYQDLNSAMQINVGIDIIRTLSKYKGFRVPLFVDRAESVTELEDAQTQVIRLVVSASDKELRCE